MEKRVTISAENTWVEFSPRKDDPVIGPSYFDVSIYGVSDSTVTLQRRFAEDDDWRTVESYTENTEKTGRAPSGGMYRVGVASGDYGTDTIEIIVRQ
jgi:hypothetical protein